VVFWGADRGQATFLDNPGGGGVPLTFTNQFARSMSLDDALAEDNLLCYEMNGEPLPAEHGAPVRLIAPGWYGVANVKWLTRIEVTDQRFAGRFMSRDYVTIREEQRDGQTVWTFFTVGRDRLKSAPAKVVRRRNGHAVMGAAWGAPIAAVEVQVDGGPWERARLRGEGRRSDEFAWVFWRLRLGRLTPGEHTIRSRAIDVDGNVQPAPDDPYWPPSAPSGRATGRSPGGCASPTEDAPPRRRDAPGGRVNPPGHAPPGSCCPRRPRAGSP